jgi:hypothetical protein
VACIDVVAKGISDSLSSAEFVYATNKSVKNRFLLMDDSATGIEMVEDMIHELALWEAQLRRVKDAARACGKEVS